MIDHPDDVSSPFVWLDDDGWWNDFLSLVFAGTAWPEGSENAIWDLAQEWGAFADDLSGAAEGLQSAAADLLAAWDAPAAAGFDDLARQLLGSPDVGLPGHLRNAVAIAQQASGFGVDLQYAKVSVNVAVAVAAMAVVLSIVLAVAGGLSLVTLGPIASIARQAVIAALEKLATAAGRRAVVEQVGRAVLDHTGALAGRGAAHSAGHHLTHEVVEEVLEELAIDVTTQAWQVSHGSRTDWNGLYTLQAAIGGGVGGAVGAGAVAPVFARLRRTPRLTALAGRGADGGRTARWGNVGIRHTGGLAATASTNVVASPSGGVAASLLTGQGFPALDWSDLGAAALGAVGRYGTVSPTNPAVLSAAVHPARTLSTLHGDALAGHTAQQAAEALRFGALPSGTPDGDVRTSDPGWSATPQSLRSGSAQPVGAGVPSAPSPPGQVTEVAAGRPTAAPPGAVAPHPSASHPSAPPTAAEATSAPPMAAPAAATGPVAGSAAAQTVVSGPGNGTTTPAGPGRDGAPSRPASEAHHPATTSGAAHSTTATPPAGPADSTTGRGAAAPHPSPGTVDDDGLGRSGPRQPPAHRHQTADTMGTGADAGESIPGAHGREVGHNGSVHGDRDVRADGEGTHGARHPRGWRDAPDGQNAARGGGRDAGADPYVRPAHPGDADVLAGRVDPGPPGRLDGGRRIGADEHAGAASAPELGGVVPPPGADQVPSHPNPQPPSEPPASEQELVDGMPEPLRRYLVEAVAHGQVWADLVREQLGDVVQHLVEQGLPAPEAVGLAHAVKGLASAARKIQPSIQSGSTFASSIWSMDDLVRFSLQIDPERYGDSVLEALDRFRALGWSVPAVPGPGETHDDWRNTWAIGNRHHGLLVVLTHAHTGQRVEMQFPTPQSWAVGKQTHALYEFLRVEANDDFERVVALARIRDIVRAKNVEDIDINGLDKLGPSKLNGAARVFAKEQALAIAFVDRATKRTGSPAAALQARGISSETAREIEAAADQAINAGTSANGVSGDGSKPSGLVHLGSSATAGQSELGAVGGGDEGVASPGASSLPPTSGGSGTGAPGLAGPDGRRGARGGEGLHLPHRDVEEARDPADPGDALGGGRGTGDHPVRRPEPHVDLRPGERERDRAPGGRGPLRPAGAGYPGAGGGGGPAEAHDPAEPGTPAGDVPQPGGPGTGHVGDPVGPRASARPAGLTGPLAVGADAATALQHVLDRTDPPVVWEGADGVLPGRVIELADGSTVRVNTGRNTWARTDPGRPLQMWTVGSFHLDDGPLTPAAAAFLTDLLTALERPGVGADGPASHWLAQRATLDPSTHAITAPGVAEATVEGGRTLVWDAAQGWVDAVRAGDLARVVDDVLLPAELFANGPAADQVVGGAHGVLDLVDRTDRAEALTTRPGTPEHDAAVEHRARLRAQLRREAGEWVAGSVGQTVAEFVVGSAQWVAGSNGRLLVQLAGGRLAVVVVAHAENDALGGSRPGLQQEGTTADIGQFRNELASSPSTAEWARELTGELQQGRVRHLRVQGVLAEGQFVGMRVTEFEVTQPAHDRPGVPRADVEPHRLVDPGLAVREAMARAVAGWTPSSVTDAIDNALRWLPYVNPLHGRFPVTNRMPWSNNCGDCSRAVADLVQGRDARAAFGDNGARVIDSHEVWGTGPGELAEMWRWAGASGGWHTGHGDVPSSGPLFTDHANARIGTALAEQSAGTVAVVLVNWADEHGASDGGHWFNAAVTELGVEWVDGQTAQHGAWPPSWTRPYSGYAVITRALGADTWVDLFDGPGEAVDVPSAPFAPGSIRSALAGGPPEPPVGHGHRARGSRTLGPDDAAFAARIADYVGDWPEDDDRREPVHGHRRHRRAPGWRRGP